MKKKKEKRVSWAPGANLCQVKYIEKAKCSSKVGPRGRNIPPRKALRFRSRCTAAYSPQNGESSSEKHKEKLSRIPQIQWEVPPVFVLKSDLHVASGEESEETAVQTMRERSVPEAVYPHFSAIPSSPFTPLDVEDQCYDDSQTPDIPMHPIEEAESAATAQSVLLPDQPKLMAPPEALNLLKKTNDLPPEPSRDSKPAPIASNASESDRLLAAVAAVSAITKTIDPESSIDTELLIKSLRDPKMTMKLIDEHRLGDDNVNIPSDSKITEPFIPLLTSKVNLVIKNSDDEESNSFVSINAAIEIAARPGSDLLSENSTEDQGCPTNSKSQVSSPNSTSGQPQFHVTKAESVSTPMPGKLDIFLPSSVVDLPRKKLISACDQLVNAEIENGPNPIISPSIVAETGTESCIRLKPGQKPETSEVMQTDKAATEQLNSTNVQNAAAAIPRPLIKQLGENIHGTGSTPKPLLNQEESMYRAVKDEHEVHDHAGKAHFSQTKSPTTNPSQPDLEALKKMIKDYGLSDLQTILLELAPAVSPAHTQELAPAEDVSQFTHQPAAFGPSSFSVRTTATSLQEDNSLTPGDNLHTIQHPAAFGPSPFSSRNTAPSLKSNNSSTPISHNPQSTQHPGAFESSHFSAGTAAPSLKGNNSLEPTGDNPQSTEHPGAFGSSLFSARTIAPPLKGNNSLEPISDNPPSTEKPGAFEPSPFSRTAESPLKGNNSLGPEDDNPQSIKHPAAFVPLTSSDRTAPPLPKGDESLEPEGGNPQSPLGPSTFSAKTTAPALKKGSYDQPFIDQHEEGEDNQDHEQSPHGDAHSYLRRPESI